jgi:Bacterial PH domain
MLGIVTPHVDLELDEGEEILHYARRHWVLLLRRIFLLVLIAGLTLGLAMYRALGGVFFASDVGPQGRLVDPANIVYLVLIAGLALVWVNRSRAATKKKQKPSRFSIAVNGLFLLGILVLGLIVYFRYSGGRIFYLDPAYARGGDVINILLILIGLFTIGALIYITIDWANDFLILTNTRVIYDDTQLLVRHVKQEILIDNVQQVNLSADSYLAYFLGYLARWRHQFLYQLGLRDQPPPEKVAVAYAKLVVGSLSVRKLVFDWAAEPAVMQSKISAELNKLRRQQEPEILRRVIEDQVYDNKPPKVNPPPIHVEEREGPLPWLFATNPEINFEKEEVTWRPYWIFLALAMLQPFMVIVLTAILLILATRLELIGGALGFVIWLPIALVCLGRIIWVREEHEHDKYILTRDKITDVDKRPFGPESSRSAQLDRIQDVSFDVSFIENFLGYGDVFIETGGGGGKFTFKHVPDPRNVTATINDYLTDYKKREKERAQKDMVALIKQYHAAQSAHNELADARRVDEAVAAKVAQMLEEDLPVQIERQVAAQVPIHVRRQVVHTLWRGMLRNRRRRSGSP